MNYQNAKSSRFSFKIEGYDLKSGVTLRFLDSQGQILREIPANGFIDCKEDSAFHYCVDDMKSETQEKFFSRFVARANKVSSAYQLFIPSLSVLGCFAYLVISLQMLREFRRKQALQTLPQWLITTGIGSTFVMFIMSMCIITATTFDALVYWYTAPAHILLLMFCLVSLGSGIDTMLSTRKRIV
jgi:4-amino-4-deoxy-L-arabinose transferase-like glycosyltransferase